MKIKFVFSTRDRVTHRQRVTRTEILTDDFDLDVLKSLWEMEYTLNHLPNTNTRVYLYVVKDTLPIHTNTGDIVPILTNTGDKINDDTAKY